MSAKYQKLLTICVVFIALMNIFLLLRPTLSQAQSSSSAIPQVISYQGRLTDVAGSPINDNIDMEFELFDAESAGNWLWGEAYTGTLAIPVVDGVFSVQLGSDNNPISETVFENPEVYLQITVDNELMTPRKRLTSVGYAYKATDADTLDGYHAESFALSNHTHPDLTGIPTGLIALFQGNSCASGWTRVAELDGKFLVGGPSYDAEAGGSNTHTHSAGTLSASSHTHSLQNITRARGWDGGVNMNVVDDLRAVIAIDFQSLNAESGGGGPISGTSAEADSRPEFATVILCQKD